MKKNYLPKKRKKEAPESNDYNERADGYGAGGAESNNVKQTYEKEREQKRQKELKENLKDEQGMPIQHGEVDQYNFRESPIKRSDRIDDASKH